MAETKTGERFQLYPQDVDRAMQSARAALVSAFEKNGWGIFASRHEMLGVICEEYSELLEAVRTGTLAAVKDELHDVAVACLAGIASLRTGKVAW